jgi:hypothetical protein
VGRPLRFGLVMAITLPSLAVLLGLVGSPSQAATVVCPSATVQSIHTSAKLYSNRNDEPVPQIEAPADHGDRVGIVVLGPILGSMDSRDVSTRATCEDNGMTIVVTIIRSASYTGVAAKNVLWQPRIDIELSASRPRITVQAIWKMRLTDGLELKTARTPPFEAETFPIVLTKTIAKPN